MATATDDEFALPVRPGRTLRCTVTWNQDQTDPDVPPVPRDTTGWTPKLQARPAPDADVLLLDLDDSDITTGGVNGLIYVVALGNKTAPLADYFGSAVYELVMINDADENDIETIIDGPLILKATTVR